MKPGRVISELFFPSGIKCVICGDDIPGYDRYAVCDRCELSHNTKYCLRCGRAMKNMADYCDYCQNHKYAFDFARAPFVYENEVVNLVHKLKYGGGKYLAEVMAEFMADEYYESGFDADIVTFVPMHEKKKHKRGYNQAEEIARALSGILELPLVDVLDRVKLTDNLAKLGKAERAEAIDGAIALNPGVKVKRKKILLVDDVFTTGATSNECARVLKRAQSSKIFVLTFATGRSHAELY